MILKKVWTQKLKKYSAILSYCFENEGIYEKSLLKRSKDGKSQKSAEVIIAFLPEAQKSWFVCVCILLSRSKKKASSGSFFFHKVNGQEKQKVL